MNRIYLCIDLKSFYASVECVARELDPLTTNLVVADKERTDKTICLAVTPSLKAYGISGRARLFEVVQRVEEINRYRRSKAPGRKLDGESYDDPELKRNPSLALSYIVAPPRMSYYMETSARIKRRIVWRCISRLDYGKKYCTESITVDEQALQRAIVRALNRFNVEDEATYLLLMKSTIGEAVGINGSSDEIDLLERRIDALNKRMLDLVSLSVQEGDDAENHEDDFKNISTQIEQLTKRITAIRESESENGDFQARLKEIQDIIDKRRENKDIYDDSIVRQMVECIKVYHDGRLQIILGGGYELEEYLEK